MLTLNETMQYLKTMDIRFVDVANVSLFKVVHIYVSKAKLRILMLPFDLSGGVCIKKEWQGGHWFVDEPWGGDTHIFAHSVAALSQWDGCILVSPVKGIFRRGRNHYQNIHRKLAFLIICKFMQIRSCGQKSVILWMWQLLIYKCTNTHSHSMNIVFHLILAFSRKASMIRVRDKMPMNFLPPCCHSLPL